MDMNEMRRRWKEAKEQKQNRLNEEVREDYTSSVDTQSGSIETIQYDNGAKYVGYLDFNGEPSGKGTFYYADGERIEALWKGGNPVHGTYYYADGDRYEGDFDENEQYSGQGTYYNADGERIEALWTITCCTNAYI